MTTKYKLVPIEPTPEMQLEGARKGFISDKRTSAIYKAMLEAAPAQESEPVAYITIPKNADEAEAMQKLGYAWLKENAPARLTQPPADKADAAPTNF